MTKPLFLSNGIFIDHKTLEFSEGNFRVGKGADGKVEQVDSIPENSEILDCTGKFITRSFINSHHHIYSALALGMPAPAKQPANFHEILKYIWWKLDRSLTNEMIELSALTTAIASIRSGVTFIIDHHSSPFSINGSLGTIEKSLSKCGISSLLCYELSDRDGDIHANEALSETEEYLKSGKQGLVGLHASFTVSEKLLGKAVSMAEQYGTGIHIHAAEDQVDQKITHSKYGKRVIERLSDSGALSLKRSILAHCIHIDNKERNILADSESWIVQNPESNLNNSVGIFDPEKLEERLLLGTDGMNSDMSGSARTAYLTGNLSGGNSPADIYNRLRNGHNYLKHGGFSGDGDNNLIVLDYRPGTNFNSSNFHSHFVYGISGNDIDSVISGGDIVMKEKKILHLDESSILKHSSELSKILWDRMKEI
ncbi:MAG: amidohydrolase family protein [Candidatus Aminicenantes bacterium]|nr:amidohydrolase family protein [Candidatus Aminicenantes bacterium]